MKRYIKANQAIHAPEELKRRTARGKGRSRRPVWPVAAALALAILGGAALVRWRVLPAAAVVPAAADSYVPDYRLPYDGTPLDEAYLDSIRRFAAKSAGELLSGEKSEAYSPSALYAALSMVAELAEGESLDALLDALEAEDVSTLRDNCGPLWRYLCANPDLKEPGKVTMANSLWLNKEYAFSGDVLQSLTDHYYAGAYTGDMEKEIPELVSRWVKEQTRGLLDCKPQTEADTMAILMSAIYFYDEWEQTFDERDSYSGYFWTGQEDVVPCVYMERKETAEYYRGNGVIAAVQPFLNGGKMLFILPEEEGVTAAGVLSDQELLASLLDWGRLEKQTGEVDWAIPRFTLSSTLDLQDGLTALGLGGLFDQYSAPLTRLSPQTPAYISRAEQGTAISINETGCEAASYVEIMMETGGIRPPEELVHMYLDHPFVFAILSGNDVPLFIGAVENPEG